MARKNLDNPKLDMTPMIDVVFQLLIFFVVNLKEEDILSKLTADRPAPTPNQSSVPENDDSIKIDIGANGFILNGRSMRLPELDRNIGQLARASTKAQVLLRCTSDSPHRYLVQALDVCNKYRMTKLSIFSM